MELPIYTGGMKDDQKGFIFTIHLCNFYRKLERRWGGSGAMMDESKIRGAGRD
jgi:hypothetical protein